MCAVTGTLSLTDDKNDFNKHVQVNRADGFFVLCVPERRTKGNDDGDVEGCDQDQPVERRFECSVMGQDEVRLLQRRCRVLR